MLNSLSIPENELSDLLDSPQHLHYISLIRDLRRPLLRSTPDWKIWRTRKWSWRALAVCPKCTWLLLKYYIGERKDTCSPTHVFKHSSLPVPVIVQSSLLALQKTLGCGGSGAAGWVEKTTARVLAGRLQAQAHTGPGFHPQHWNNQPW